MKIPIIAGNQPIKIELKQGKEYHFCTCGKSNGQPFCDGSHQGTEFVPMAFTAEKDGPAHLCQCKQTRNSPFCDGTHTKVPDTEIGKPFLSDDSASEA